MGRVHLCGGRDLPFLLRAGHARLTAATSGMAVVLLLGAPQRSSAPAFEALRAWMPMRAWGVAWLLVTLHLLYAACQARMAHLHAAAVVAGGLFTVLALALLAAALANPAASFIGVVALGYCATAAYSVSLLAASAHRCQTALSRAGRGQDRRA